jgi:hypothetical protein
MKKDTTPIDFTWISKTGGFAKDMTLRDHYAGLAMQSFIYYAGVKGIYCPNDQELTREAYCLADAMLKARAK